MARGLNTGSAPSFSGPVLTKLHSTMTSLLPTLRNGSARHYPVSSLLADLWTNNIPLDGGMYTKDEDGTRHLLFDVPGVAKDDVAISYADGVLEIEAKRGGVAERVYRWRYRLAGVNPDSITAKLENGVLEVSIPTHDMRHRIEVK